MPDELDTEEIEVTALIERIDSLEKENRDQKAKILALESACDTLGASIDRLADLLARKR